MYNSFMLIPVHDEMTREALGSRFSPRALEVILAANRKQDSPRNQIGHDEIHFDNNAIEAGKRYIIEQRGYVIASLLSPGVLAAWVAFGRLTHTAQDFYSHTNYVSLWLAQFDGTPPPPSEIDPVQKSLLQSPNLHSGKIHFPLDALYFIPFLRSFALSLLPDNSHGKMNLDSPAQGEKFAYARAAAVKRTVYEFELLKKILTPEMFAKFTDL
ncbi:MAG: hypothetical protein LDL51_00160 [Chloroflexi bacterium]|nr:hypothetical protein [Chloroflexota bacterium]